MKNWLVSSMAVTAAAAAMMLLASAPAAGQGEAIKTQRAPKGPSKPAPRMADGKPDFGGVWSADRNFIYDIRDALAPGEDLPLQPWAAKLAKERLSKQDPEANCLPTGVPRQAPYPWRVMQSPTHVYFLFEGNIHSYRQIFMNRDTHPKDLNPTWYGDSIGKWDGDTLVVDSVGFNDRFWFDFAGHPHTEQLHVTERYRRTDNNHLDYDTIVDDPGAYTRPFTLHGHSTLQNTELMEYICNENNVDVTHIVGKDPRNQESKEK